MWTINKKIKATVQLLPDIQFESAKAWLSQQAAVFDFAYLLAHTETGVIWGRVESGELITSHDETALLEAHLPQPLASLDDEHLRMARLFSQAAEWLLWRDDDGVWSARCIQDGAAADTADFQECIDEPHILWGTQAQPLKNNFTLMSDGVRGLQHVVPIPVDLKEPVPPYKRPLRLHVRHYLANEVNGRIVASRLLDLTTTYSEETDETHS